MGRFLSIGLVALLIGAAPAPATKLPKAGTYELAIMAAPGIELVYGLIKITPKDDGTVDTELVATSPRSPNLSLGDATLKGDILRIDLKNGNTKMTFEGKVPQSGAEKLRGTISDETRPTPATLTFTKKLPSRQIKRFDGFIAAANAKSSRIERQGEPSPGPVPNE